MPPIIYGVGEGPINQRSIQILTLCKVALERGKAVTVGKGESRWGSVHVGDIAKLIASLAEAGAKENQDEALWGENGIYLTGVDELVRTVPHSQPRTRPTNVSSLGWRSHRGLRERPMTRATSAPPRWNPCTSRRWTRCYPRPPCCSEATREARLAAGLSFSDGHLPVRVWRRRFRGRWQRRLRGWTSVRCRVGRERQSLDLRDDSSRSNLNWG